MHRLTETNYFPSSAENALNARREFIGIGH
jgi:hypothetical protein